MILLTELAEVLAAVLARRTGVVTCTQRLYTAVYPMYALQLVPEQSVLAAGGQQLLRTVTGTVACYGSRQRQDAEGLDLADRLLMALAAGVPVGDRHLTPVHVVCRVRENRPEVSFQLVFYDLVEGVVE